MIYYNFPQLQMDLRLQYQGNIMTESQIANSVEIKVDAKWNVEGYEVTFHFKIQNLHSI